MIHPENKLIQGAGVISANYSYMNQICINAGPIQGLTNGDRTGNRICMKSVQFKVTAVFDTAVTTDNQFYRWGLLLYKDQEGNDPIITEVFQTSLTSAQQTMCYYNTQNIGAYKMLYDSGQRCLGQIGGQQPVRTHKVTRKLNKVTVYSGNTGLYTVVAVNGLWFWSMGANTTANCPYLFYNYRIRYLDC